MCLPRACRRGVHVHSWTFLLAMPAFGGCASSSPMIWFDFMNVEYAKLGGSYSAPVAGEEGWDLCKNPTRNASAKECVAHSLRSIRIHSIFLTFVTQFSLKCRGCLPFGAPAVRLKFSIRQTVAFLGQYPTILPVTFRPLRACRPAVFFGIDVGSLQLFLDDLCRRRCHLSVLPACMLIMHDSDFLQRCLSTGQGATSRAAPPPVL